MATLAPVNTPARQPFGLLNDSKLRSLQSLKNRQNSIVPSSAPSSLKRRAPSPENGGSDTENVDPNILDSLHKRKRSAFDDDVSIAKSHRYSLNVTSTIPSVSTRPISTPRLDTFVKPSTTPASAPAAGRSPTRKRSSGLLHSRKRFNPPAFSTTQSPSLSLSAALNGTKKSRLSSRKSRTNQSIESSKPKTWFFDIYEESQEAQDYRMNEWTMTQSTTGLDISDDESKSTRKNASDRGKENIDPNELPTAPVTRSMAAAAATAKSQEREFQMTDKEARSPLGDLNPADYYAEGLDATSVVLVQDDEEAETDVEGDEPNQPHHHDFTFQPPPSISSTAQLLDDMHTPSLAEILSAATPTFGLEQVEASSPQVSMTITNSSDATAVNDDGDGDIQIWESESAKDEHERCELLLEHDAGVPGSPRSVSGDENAFALQEL